ncbi:MAG: DUF2274 domain-containing protein [Sphingomonas sp.]|uniref:DUF2274 domain-containing protein n=1 Tax=Sphingomonas sp. TaxID=28214 RepID=UPI001AC23606|nr:DUF2274 domain-containing protein [Sphingomonas sp.]MBN8807963.1 DUF2274 domain-containing protein [Sphingomonas sp.]
MSALKLPRLDDRTPVKLGIVVTPQLHADLQLYAQLYRDAYGVEEVVTELIPPMLASFLASDRAFARARTASK